MWILKTSLKAIGPPGSIPFLVAGCSVGLTVTYVWPRNRRLGRSFLVVLYLGYLLMGLPVVANAVAHRLTMDEPADNPATRGRITRLIVLDGDNIIGRVTEAARVYETSHPIEIVASGREWLVKSLVEDAGVPALKIVRETSSSNTFEQIEWVQRFAADHPQDRFGLIASRLQMPRIRALLRDAQLPMVLIRSPTDTELPTVGVRALIPTYTALGVTRDALYEHVALRYYRWQHWIH